MLVNVNLNLRTFVLWFHLRDIVDASFELRLGLPELRKRVRQVREFLPGSKYMSR